jgi:UDP-N-acetylglucosamine--N-acetylmuramyl-(pentapeptide) pyrophosphoryl-undecaprenol N-acetylglucosamine transferase
VKLLITGGHHSSAIPVIHKLRENHPEILLYWIGHRHSMRGDLNDTLEYREITLMGIPFYELRAGKVYKALTIKNVIKIPLSLITSYRYLASIHPNIVLSFGGYLAVPVVIMAWFMGIPVITHEQTVAAGYANRLISKFAKKILISWKESESYFPKNKTVFTGLPLRQSIFEVKSNVFATENKLPYVYITAGKTGSVKINKLIKEALPRLLNFCNVIHQCGDHSLYSHYTELSEYYAKIKHALTGKYFLKQFIFEDEIGEAYHRACLVVSRSGAHTISEILALNKPCLLIPIPWVSHNEQFKNAEVVKNANLGEITDESLLTPEVLVEKINYMLQNQKSYSNTAVDYYISTNKNAVDLIINEVLGVANKL